MLSRALFTAAKGAASFSCRNLSSCSVARTITTHASCHQKDTEKIKDTIPSKSKNFRGNFSEWYALPIGIAAAIPAIKFEWYVINEETQLAAVFIAFCVAVYKSGGEAIYKFLDERAQIILKDHNRTEGKVIEALQLKLDFLKANQNMVRDFENINTIREQAYTNLSAVGVMKPKHVLRYQIERVLNMIITEEAIAAEKTKVALMNEAICVVKTKFLKSKQQKKSALDAAIATIQGEKVANEEPVHMSFVQFFKEKAITASKVVDKSEEKSRSALIAKLNNLCKTEEFLFEFDASGTPKMLV